MKILALDDEPLALESLLDAIHKAAPDADSQGYEYAEDVLDAARRTGCDAAFLDVEMSGMNGVGLAEQLKAINPEVNIIFCTGFTRYQGEAFALHASGYLLKPITPEKVRQELAELRRPVPTRHRLRAQCFGNFEVYLNDAPLNFHYNRTKELLAYLIDRCGALCTNGAPRWKKPDAPKFWYSSAAVWALRRENWTAITTHGGRTLCRAVPIRAST